MDFSALWKLLRPKSFLCISLVLLLIYLPKPSYGGGKKHLPPVKHLFGVGIGYQRVVNYKPVLLIQKHRRIKKRPHGWGWKGGGGGGWKSYTPVVIQHHVHGKGHGHGYGYGHGHGHHSKRRRRPQHGGGHRHRGWGWGWRRRRRPRKGHHEHGHGHQSYHSSGHSGWKQSHHESSQPEYHPTTGGGADDVEYHDGNDWESGTGSGTGFGYHREHDDDQGGYESEIKENWSTSTTASPSSPLPSLYPFTEPPKTDVGVAKIHKAFLKTHLKHFRETTTTNQPIMDDEDEPPLDPTHFSPMKPPGPNYSTMELRSQEQINDEPHQFYDDDFIAKQMSSSSTPTDNFESNEVRRRRKLPTLHFASDPNEPSGIINPSASSGFMHMAPPTMPKASTTHTHLSKHSKPNTSSAHPFVNSKEDFGVGDKFSDPSFFPSFDQFQKIKIDKKR